MPPDGPLWIERVWLERDDTGALVVAYGNDQRKQTLSVVDALRMCNEIQLVLAYQEHYQDLVFRLAAAADDVEAFAGIKFD